mmetsp:Transcript_17456/g.53957  ORF Transcript_17456/g.53957 Transcript_17456/m.53957 type:complete len:174 (-) Transcript_17456:373-894(-)
MALGEQDYWGRKAPVLRRQHCHRGLGGDSVSWHGPWLPQLTLQLFASKPPHWLLEHETQSLWWNHPEYSQDGPSVVKPPTALAPPEVQLLLVWSHPRLCPALLWMLDLEPVLTWQLTLPMSPLALLMQQLGSLSKLPDAGSYPYCNHLDRLKFVPCRALAGTLATAGATWTHA